jgi:hypothetical protein
MSSTIRGTNLTYDQLVATVQDGDIVFVHGKSSHPIQALIMFATRSKFSHVFIAFSAPIANNKYNLLVEAQGGTDRRILTVNYYKNYRFTVVTPPKPWPDVQATALAEIGEVPYSYLEAVYVGLRTWLFNSLTVRLPRLHFDEGQICSEFVASVYGLPQDVTPQGLFDQLTS